MQQSIDRSIVCSFVLSFEAVEQDEVTRQDVRTCTREKRERVPRPILDRNEANGGRIAPIGFSSRRDRRDPVISPTLDSAGKTRPAAPTGRGTILRHVLLFPETRACVREALSGQIRLRRNDASRRNLDEARGARRAGHGSEVLLLRRGRLTRRAQGSAIRTETLYSTLVNFGYIIVILGKDTHGIIKIFCD